MTTAEYMEKLDILAYMVENGYHLGDHDMDFYAQHFTAEDLRRWCRRFMGDTEE